jgi:hypothetical protein
MYILHIFRTDPFAGTAVLLCLATIFWCIRVVRRRQRGADRFLLGLLGLIAICQALRIFKDIGVWTASQPFHRLDDFVNLATGGLYLIGALLLEISSRDRISAELSLRLAQANPGKQPDSLHKLTHLLIHHVDGSLNYGGIKVRFGVVETIEGITKAFPRCGRGIQGPMLPAPQGSSYGSHQDRICGFQESRVKWAFCGIAAKSRFFDITFQRT